MRISMKIYFTKKLLSNHEYRLILSHVNMFAKANLAQDKKSNTLTSVSNLRV